MLTWQGKGKGGRKHSNSFVGIKCFICKINQNFSDLKYLLGKVRERVVENILILSLELNVLFAK